MKKVLFSMAMFSMVALMAACGGNEKKADPATDGKTAAEMKCKCQKLEGEEADKCNKEADAKLNELKAQYKDDQLKAFEDAFNKFECKVDGEEGNNDGEAIENGKSNDNDAMMAAVKMAADDICGCAKEKDATFEKCFNKVISNSAEYVQYKDNKAFYDEVVKMTASCFIDQKTDEAIETYVPEEHQQTAKNIKKIVTGKN